MRMAGRLEAMGQAKYAGLTHDVNGNTVWTGQINLDRAALELPTTWKKPRRVFVNSMSDLFHENVPDRFIAQVFDAMQMNPRHTFMVLTKRPERMAKLVKAMSGSDYPIAANVWLGVSVEDQRAADERIPLLLQTPASIRFLSCEPLLGPVAVARWFTEVEYNDHIRGGSPLHWVIAGGESGPGARTMHPDWARSLRDQCQAAGVPFFFKQWGMWQPREGAPASPVGARHWHIFDDGQAMYRLPKHAAGRELDGRTWNEVPEGVPTG
jgi:protein gp37